MKIFHIATEADWAEAERTGRYTTSTRGRSLAEEGFIHASRGDQWQGVRQRSYADIDEPLLLLAIDTDKLSAPVVEEAGEPGGETFPHVYGAIETGAVTQVIRLDPDERADEMAAPVGNEIAAQPAPTPRSAAGGETFGSIFMREIIVRAVVGTIVLVVVVGVGALAIATAGNVAALVAMLVTLAVGVALAALYLRRRENSG